MTSLFQELKRRNVFRVGIAYVVTAWLLVQVADVVLDSTDAPDWVMQVFMLALALGFPVAALFAWAYELTPEGLKKEKEVDRSQSITNTTGRKLDYSIIAVLVVALGYFAWDKFLVSPPATSEATAQIAEAEESLAVPAESEPSSVDSETSIAVLPFVNLSPDPDQEFFSDGISEELLNVLAQYPGLRVAARTSSFQFKGENKDISEIARQLNVNHVLEGSVRKSGTKLRITAQLIDANSGFHLWSNTYDRELDDVFAIQDEISAAIGDALHAQLELGEDQPVVATSENTAAYEAFLQGRHLINQRGSKNIREGVEHLERCVRLDPDFAPGRAWLAIGYALLLASPSSYGDLSLAEVLERATPQIEAALALDPNLAEAHGAKALLGTSSNAYNVAFKHTALALELNPAYVDALNWRQIAATSLGEYAESNRILERILEIDPLSIIGRLNFVTSHAINEPVRSRRVAEGLIENNPWAGYTSLAVADIYPTGDLSGSLKWSLMAYQIESADEFTNSFIVQILSGVGEFDEARRITNTNLYMVDILEGNPDAAAETLTRELERDSSNFTIMGNLADALHLAGRFEESQRYYSQLVENSPTGLVLEQRDSTLLSHVRMAYGLSQLGQDSAAQAALEQQEMDLKKRIEAETLFPSDHRAEAIAQAMKGNEALVFDALRNSIAIGLRDMTVFNEPALAGLADHPEMLAIAKEMQHLLDTEHAEILQLICHENPALDTWQPRRETCGNVPDQGP